MAAQSRCKAVNGVCETVGSLGPLLHSRRDLDGEGPRPLADPRRAHRAARRARRAAVPLDLRDRPGRGRAPTGPARAVGVAVRAGSTARSASSWRPSSGWSRSPGRRPARPPPGAPRGLAARRARGAPLRRAARDAVALGRGRPRRPAGSRVRAFHEVPWTTELEPLRQRLQATESGRTWSFVRPGSLLDHPLALPFPIVDAGPSPLRAVGTLPRHRHRAPSARPGLPARAAPSPARRGALRPGRGERVRRGRGAAGRPLASSSRATPTAGRASSPPAERRRAQPPGARRAGPASTAARTAVRPAARPGPPDDGPRTRGAGGPARGGEPLAARRAAPRAARSSRPSRACARATSPSASASSRCSARPRLVLATGAQRARRLARQQIEFVAGVTHELNTPLAAIRSAGQNLADGIVTDPPPGAPLRAAHREGGRPPHRARGAGARLRRHRVRQPRVRRRAARGRPPRRRGVLRDLRLVLEQAGMTVEKDVAPDLPAVRGDAAALRRVLANLVANAVEVRRGRPLGRGARGPRADGGRGRAARRGPRARASRATSASGCSSPSTAARAAERNDDARQRPRPEPRPPRRPRARRARARRGRARAAARPSSSSCPPPASGERPS